MASYNATNARKNFYSLIKHVNDTNDVLTITAKQGNVVVLSESEWDNIVETMQLSAIPGMARSIQEGLNEPLSNSSDKLEW